LNTSQAPRVVTTRIEPALYERLAHLAAEEDRSQSSVMRRALRAHLDGRPPRINPPDQTLKKEAV
jgi:predicted transcriptional regulator